MYICIWLGFFWMVPESPGLPFRSAYASEQRTPMHHWHRPFMPLPYTGYRAGSPKRRCPKATAVAPPQVLFFFRLVTVVGG